ncbi:MAG: DUF1257 domain-containing protein [Proteobacteria bacterium]|nr:DUF1257 domain-containing protein [Pseudomonadota bacterium]
MIKISHIAKIELEIKLLDALIAACNRLGFEFVKNQKTYEWYGRYMRDTPLPEGITENQLGKCDHAIKVPGCSYEIGIVKRNNNYHLLWDSWESQLRLAIGKNAGIIKQAYTTEVVRHDAKIKGYRITEKQTEKGIRLILQK